jgi:protein-disulfide isomerase
VPILEQVLENNPGNVKIVFKNFPLRSHKFARNAATAALVAKGQGKFWEFHDLLFENYRELDQEKIEEIAKQLGLDETAFKEQLKNPILAARVRQDTTEGVRADVRGTPTVFVNGRRLRNRTLDGFQVAVDRELMKLKEAE